MYNVRILGDATGEMGSFSSIMDPDGTSKFRSSWYGDYGLFANVESSWFVRGGAWYNGVMSGIFASRSQYGETYMNGSFRVVLSI